MSPDSPATFLTFPGGYMRPVEAADLHHLYVGVNNPEITMYLARYLPVTQGQEKNWIEDLGKRSDTNIVVMVVVDDVPIGTLGIHNIDHKNRTAVTGAMFFNQSYWNKGYGHKAKMILLRYAFMTLNLRQVYSEVLGFNGRSAAYNRKCGYVDVGAYPNDHYLDGRYWDRLHMMLTKEAWLKRYETFKIEHKLESLEEMVERHRHINK